MKVIFFLTFFCFLMLSCGGTVTVRKTTTSYGYQPKEVETDEKGKDETKKTDIDETDKAKKDMTPTTNTNLEKIGKVTMEEVGLVGKVVVEETKPQSIFKSPWFWFGVGVVVVGGVIGVVYFLSGSAVSVSAAGVVVP
jgi:hypothetical protein